MSDPRDMSQGWRVRAHDGSLMGQQDGPYSWDQMVSFAKEGRVLGHNIVWHPSLPDWMPAHNVPNLFEQPPTDQPVAPQPVAPQPVAPQPVAAASGGRPPRRTGRKIALVALVILLLALLGAGAFWLLGDGGDLGDLIGGDSSPDLGTAEITLPDSAALVGTADWGEVPANQIGITLLDGFERDAAEAVAASLSGTIVGELEYIAMFQIQFPGEAETDLQAALDTAAAAEGIEFAFPNQQVALDGEIWGVRVTPYDDPIYSGGAGGGYQAIGVDRAWILINGAGVKLNNVHVGIVDDGLYREGEGRMGEFGGKVKINFPDPGAGELNSKEVRKDGTVNPAGSHGTGVATIIGADPDNGGPSGIAGPLGDNLEISMINQYGGGYGIATSTPDPDDPTKINWGNGQTYSFGSLIALNKQIEAGATIINCSWGNPNADPQLAAAYKKYFEKMAQDHPDVLFVCSGGNTGTALDGSKRIPSGLALSNMITVGAVDNDGTLADYSSRSSDNYEVTLGAPGTDAVVGQRDDGSAERQDGTSFSAPHVAAAAAILRSIDPNLSAGDIKRILVETARAGITVGDTSNLAPPEVGGRILAIDQAVMKVINDLRAAEGLPALTEEMLVKLSVIDAVAITGDPGEYTVKGIIEAAGEDGTGITIGVSGNHVLGGSSTQSLSDAGAVQWGLSLLDDEGVVTVTRLDSGAMSVITIDSIDINGMWSGTFTFTEVDMNVTSGSSGDDPESFFAEGCSTTIAAIIEGLVGVPLPTAMDITVDDNGNGTAIMTITFDGNPDSTELNVTYAGNAVTFTRTDGEEGTLNATVSHDDAGFVMNGTMEISGPGGSINAAFSLTKPE